MDTSIFEKHSIHCPICKTNQTFSELKSSSYVIVKRDSNGYPTEIKWYDDSHSDINIHHYYYWTCDSCFYTDKVTNFFKAESAQSEFLKSYRRTSRELGRTSNTFLSLCTSRLSAERSQTYEKSLLQSYTHLFTLTKMPENSAVHHAIGDSYLRISWLLYENKFDEKNPTPKNVTRDFNELLSDNFETYLTSFQRFEHDITNFKNEIINLLHKSVNESNKETIREHYKHVKTFNTNLEKSITFIHTLNEKFVEST